MNPNQLAAARPASVLATNKLVRNTYTLLSLTLLFGALTATLAMRFNLNLNPIITLCGYFALLFITSALRNSVWGLLSVFALTGLLGLTLGSIIDYYVHFYSNGTQLVMLALGGTGTIFLGLSGYALVTRADFSFMAGFLMTGILVAFLAALATLLFPIPALSLAISAVFILLMSGLILYQTSQMIHGGETNYIMATVTLYVAIYNLFTSLLHLLMAFAGSRE